MKPIKTWAILLLCLALPLPAFGYSILAIGDSITVGYPYTYPAKSGNGQRFGSYESYLESLLSQAGYPSAVYNWGVGGETTFGGVGRINAVLNSRHADFILIMEGANDLYSGISSNTTSINIGIMIDRALSKRVNPIIGTITPNSMTSGYDARISDNYNPKIISKALNKNVKIADQYTALRSQWNRLHSGDGLHPNMTGYHKMANTWHGRIVSGTANIVPMLYQLLLE